MSEQQTENPLRDAIAEAIRDNEVILFMKGTPEAPACGFSMRTVQALQATGAAFAAVDILPDPRIRQELSALSNWPTIPQLFVKRRARSAAATSSPRCTSPASSHEALGVEAPAAAGPGPGETADPAARWASRTA